MINKIRLYCYAIKYWFHGDDWNFALEYADVIVNKWNNHSKEKK